MREIGKNQFKGTLIFLSLLILMILTVDNVKGDIPSLEQVALFQQRLKNISNRYPDNPEIQLGVAELCYSRYGNRNEAESYYRKVIAIDPENRPAYAKLMRNIFWSYIQGWEQYYEELEEAEAWEKGELEIPPGHALADYLKSKEGRQDNAEYCRQSASKIRKQAEKETPYVLAELEKAQKVDPDNSLYNYLRASVYLWQGKKEEAIREIEEGLQNKTLHLYSKEKMAA